MSIALDRILQIYEFEVTKPPAGEKYAYNIGDVVMPRKPVPLKVSRREHGT
jgi:hypothetical protein